MNIGEKSISSMDWIKGSVHNSNITKSNRYVKRTRGYNKQDEVD